MFSKWIDETYGIRPDRQIRLGSYEGLISNDVVYLLAPLGESPEYLIELKGLADHLIQRGDRHVLSITQTKSGELFGTKEGKAHCLLSCRLGEKQNDVKQVGRKLAKFHLRGLSIPFKVERTSRIGQWKQLWEKRMDQMETVWQTKIYQTPENEFEKMFIESYPYYMGLAENAIQYLVDAEMDETPGQMDHGTVCHERFSNQSWGKEYVLKNPLDWVFDHRSRDLAEWTREVYFESKQTHHQPIRKFFKDYQSLAPLSAFGWRLLFARLLFPLHFVECVEGYYMTQSEQDRNSLEEKFQKHLQSTSDYERFIGEFYSLAEVPLRKLKIPQLDWLEV
ncbi:spore coat putative kinase YutH [Bacillus sp. CGMCC 1.16607]|uniref:spore coat putative kinase YutH n=1 Tax=Bacillus sp. CGMCC 1.16607 TaxID=3351842 RepID=UPI003642CB86